MTTFSVTLRGRRAAADPAETVARLAALLGCSAADAERALARSCLTVKRGVDLRTANRYQAALDDCGGCATIEREHIAEASFDGIPEHFRPLAVQLRKAEMSGHSRGEIHASIVNLLANGEEGAGMARQMNAMCGGHLSIGGLLRYFSADRLQGLLADAESFLDAFRRGDKIPPLVFSRHIDGSYSSSAGELANHERMARLYEALITILRDQKILGPGNLLPPEIVLRDGKGDRLPAQGQQVQFCQPGSAIVRVGTVNAYYDVGASVSYRRRDGYPIRTEIPYANLFLDGGNAFRLIPDEAILDRQVLRGLSLPMAPARFLMGDGEVMLELASLPVDERRYFFLDLEDKVKHYPSSSLTAKKIGPTTYGLGQGLDLAAHASIIAGVLAPFQQQPAH